MTSPVPTKKTTLRAPLHRGAFTLFELILAIALSVVLVALIGTAINLYLTRVDGSRTQVEEAQLARSILAMIADDIRAATIYQPQDTSAIAQLLSSTQSFDVDSIDDERSGGSGGGGGESGGGAGDGGSGGGGGMSMGGGAGGSSSGGGGTGGGGSGGLSSGMSAMGGNVESPETMPLGLSGTLDELSVDSTRLPRREELFATVTGYTNAPTGGQAGSAATSAAAANMQVPADLKTVRYFIRQGNSVESGSTAATSLDPSAQLLAGGLVRQEIPRLLRVWAEQSGNTTIMNSGQALIAPEVVNLEFRYFDGTQVVEYWDMKERQCLPMAVEVRLWITPTAAGSSGQLDLTHLANTARMYQQTVYLPMSALSSAGAAGGMSGSGGASSQSGTGSGMSSGSSTTGGASMSEF